MESRIDILNLEWSSFMSRDRQMASLTCNYLRHQGYTVIEGCIFQGYELLRKYRPKVLFISNAVGSTFNFDICKYASKIGINVVTLTSEGNFREKDIDQFLWGWNIDHVLYETYNLLWSERTKNLVLKYYPSLKDKIMVSGGVGFDIYKIKNYINKNKFLEKYKKNDFSKIVGIGCWDFGPFYPEDSRYQINSQKFSESEIEYMRLDRLKFNEILIKLVSENKDILFLIKEHPGSQLGKKSSAIENLDKYENVLILKFEEPIINCISVSDFWVAYESTTALEAWLMNKQTCLLNPQGGSFRRDDIYLGSPIIKDSKEFQDVIDIFYSSGKLIGFENRKNLRDKLVIDTIQFDDGLNHVRAGNKIIELVDSHNNNDKYSFPITLKVLYTYLGWYFSPYLRFVGLFKWYFKKLKEYNSEELHINSTELLNEQKRFYKSIGSSTKQLRKFECI